MNLEDFFHQVIFSELDLEIVILHVLKKYGTRCTIFRTTDEKYATSFFNGSPHTPIYLREFIEEKGLNVQVIPFGSTIFLKTR